MKYKIELSEEQMRLVADRLEDIARFASGQMELIHTTEEIFRGLSHEECMRIRDQKYLLIDNLKQVILPQLAKNVSYGYNSTEFIGNLYQIYRTILHQLSVDNNWNNVYSSSALPSGNMVDIKITKILKKIKKIWRN
jgi:hypothetical protein